MIDLLKKIFYNFSLEDIDSLKDVIESQIYQEFIRLFPNLESILSFGHKNNDIEFDRTVKHIFRSIKVLLSIYFQEFQYGGLSSYSIKQILVKIKEIDTFNQNLIPLILVYHDIGKFIRKRDHPQQSFNLISENELLKPFKLDKDVELLIEKVIQYHILFATIYTGESTYYGTYSLINDEILVNLISISNNLDIFVDSLEVFTYIDILGYSYSQIFDHYLIYYKKLNNNLKSILSRLPNTESALNIALELSNSSIEWRIAGALRIFQFVTTKPYLTEGFYFDKLKSSIVSLPTDLSGFNWNDLIDEILIDSYRIQIKYGLPFLMILAFRSFSRANFDKDAEISPNLIYFWIQLTKEINKRSSEHPKSQWNVYVLGIKNWFLITPDVLKIIDPFFLQDIIKNSKSTFDKSINEFTFNLDLSKLEKVD
jgi:hypothetical protein